MSEPDKAKTRVDEDVDDLDDILDEFSSQEPPKPAAAASAASASAPAKASTSSIPPADRDAFNAEFADEFAKQMEAALRELGGDSNVAASSSTEHEKEGEQAEAFRKAWEKILVDGMNGIGEDNDVSGPEDPFQKNIREAMERLKQSDANIPTNASTETDDFEKLLQSLGDGTTDDDLNGILENMMGQLMSKDVLYEPLKELQEKFPTYLKENEGKIQKSDKTRYEAQISVIQKILVVFEDPAYKDEDATKGAEVVTLMSEMQALGSPPEELMGPLPPGLNLGSDGMPKIPDECIIT